MKERKSMKQTEEPVSYVLRCCNSEGGAYGGFQWPLEAGGVVEAADWRNEAECGHGLHGWLHGEGDVTVSRHYDDDDARWYVLEVPTSSIVDLGAKVKFPRAKVLFVGGRSEAVARIMKLCPGRATIFGTATAGVRGTATAGYAGTATAGARGTATAGDAGTATAGDAGTATAGARGTATAGYAGTATAGDAGTATAGDDGVIVIRRWNGKRWKLVVGYIGEDGIEPNTPYKLDSDGAFVKVSP